MSFPSYPGPFVRSDASAWEDFLDLGVRRSFRADESLFQPGDTVRHLYYVQQGAILVTHFSPPDDVLKVNIIGERAVAGLVEMFAPSPPRAAWRTLLPCVCVLFSRQCVERDLPRQLLVNLLEQAAFMSTSMVGRFAQGLNRRNDVRLARFLLHAAASQPGGIRPEEDGVTIVPGITQEFSSDLLGMHPATFNKLLAAFRRQGIIGKTKKNGVEILDVAALARYAEGL